MFGLLFIKDLVEILFLSGAIYYFSLWLKKDRRHNLLVYFYAYCAIFLVANLLHLPTISAFLAYSSPLILILFIIFHQELLQRNFITLAKASVTISEEADEWLENIIRASLYAINNNKQLLCVIENHSDLKPFLDTPVIFNSPLQQNILMLLLDSNGFDAQKLLWCNTHGRLVGINCTWRITSHDVWQSSQVKELPSWQQDALLMTLKTDTIVFKADPAKRTFDLITKGTLHENISAHHTLALIKKQLPQSQTIKGDLAHDSKNKKPLSEQSNH